MYTSTLFFILLVTYVSASKDQFNKDQFSKDQFIQSYHKINSTRPAPSNRVTAKSSRSDYHHYNEHHYPHHFGGHLGYGGHYKDLDHYLLPMLIVLGLGVLCMPLISVLMSTMIGNVPVTTLVSGRRKRQAVAKPVPEETIMELWKKVGRAIEVFTKDDK